MNSQQSRKFLLIGAGGLVGRHVRLALADQCVIPTFRHPPPGGGVALDITDEAAIRRTIREHVPDVIVLAAADAHVERCEREPEMTRRINVDAPRVIAEESQRVGAQLVTFSSEYVFDGTAGAYREQDQRRPLNEYGRQKVALEDLTLGAGRGLVLRTSGVFGVDAARKNFVYQLVDRLRSGLPFDVASDQLITPTFAPSLARAVVDLSRAGATGIIHAAGPQIMRRVDFAALVATTFGLPRDLIRERATAELRLAAARPLRCGLMVDRLAMTLGRFLDEPGAGLVAMHEVAG